MKKAFILILICTFFIGMWMGTEISNVVSKFTNNISEIEMVEEEDSSTIQKEDAWRKDYYVMDKDIVSVAVQADQEQLLSELVQAIHNDVNTLTIKHDAFTLEYLSTKTLSDDLITTSTKKFDWLNYKKANNLYYLQTYLPIIYWCVEPIYYHHFETTFDPTKIAYVESKARSPGKDFIPYGRINPIPRN